MQQGWAPSWATSSSTQASVGDSGRRRRRAGAVGCRQALLAWCCGRGRAACRLCRALQQEAAATGKDVSACAQGSMGSRPAAAGAGRAALWWRNGRPHLAATCILLVLGSSGDIDRVQRPSSLWSGVGASVCRCLLQQL